MLLLWLPVQLSRQPQPPCLPKEAPPALPQQAVANSEAETDQLLAKAKPISKGGSTSGLT